MAVTTSIDKFRLELGDTPAAYGLTNTQLTEFNAAALLNDAEITYFLGKHPTNLLLAVADACDALAARFAKAIDFTANDAKSFSASQKHGQYLAMAERLRSRANTEGNSDGTGGLALGSFPGPYGWVLT